MSGLPTLGWISITWVCQLKTSWITLIKAGNTCPVISFYSTKPILGTEGGVSPLRGIDKLQGGYKLRFSIRVRTGLVSFETTTKTNILPTLPFSDVLDIDPGSALSLIGSLSLFFFHPCTNLKDAPTPIPCFLKSLYPFRCHLISLTKSELPVPSIPSWTLEIHAFLFTFHMDYLCSVWVFT